MKVLFICKGNIFRSQMAAAIYNKLTNSNDAFSVGTYVGAPEEPEGQKLVDLRPYFVEFMKEREMDISKNKTTKLTPELINEYDLVIAMAEEPYIPPFLKENTDVIWWKVENPTSVNEKVATDTYNILHSKINELLQGGF